MSSIENLKDILHDFKTPLTSILGYVELLRESRDRKNREKFLNVIEEESNRILSMIDSFLEVYDLSQRIDVLDCSQMADFIYNEFCPLARSKDICISINCEKKLKIFFNEIDFRRASPNIVENAIKYGRHGGFLSVNVYREFDFVIWEFIDNGIGISEENLTNIFKRGFRENSSKSCSGCGYGLNNVKKIVSMNDGIISVQSKLGEGTKFMLKLRRAE